MIFIDDYANTMIVGATMRGVTDRQRISREKLAFIVDATAAPVAGIAVLSTWIGYEVGLLSGAARSLGVAKDGYEIFFDAIGFRFYCILMIAFVFLNAWSGEDFGPMARAQRRAEAKGKTPNGKTSSAIPDAFASAGSHPEGRASASVAVVPMLALLAVFLAGIWIGGSPDAPPQRGPWAILHMSAWRGALGKADSILMLVYASLTGLLAAVALAKTVARVPIAAIVKAAVVGAKSSMLPVAILALAWALKGACDELRIALDKRYRDVRRHLAQRPCNRRAAETAADDDDPRRGLRADADRGKHRGGRRRGPPDELASADLCHRPHLAAK